MSPDAVLHAGAPTEDPAEGRPQGHAHEQAAGHSQVDREAHSQDVAQGGEPEADPDGPPAVRSAAPLWRLVDRGRFVVGLCDACGYTSPARRARFSAESDMLAHEILCDALR